MDLILVHRMYDLAKAMTYSFAITSLACAYFLMRVMSSIPLTTDQLLRDWQKFLGKKVKIIGTAIGESFKVIPTKSFNLPKTVILSIQTKIHHNWYRNISNQSKLNSFLIKGTENSLKVLVNDRTNIIAPVVYESSSRPFSGFSNILSSICHSFISLFRKDIDLSYKTRLVKRERAIFEGSRVVVNGVLMKNNQGLHVVSSSVAAGEDFELITSLNRLKFSLKLLASAALALLLLKVYSKCRTGQLKIFSKSHLKNENVASEAGECIICLDHKRNIIIQPCNHIAICNFCAEISKCPICRTEIENLVKIEYIKI